MRLPSLFAIPALLLFASRAIAQTPYPEITYVHPGAVQRGASNEVTVVSRHTNRGFETATQVFFGGTGLDAQVLPRDPKAPPQRRKLKVTAAPDAPLGLHEMRVATASGVSSIGELLVVEDPVVVEIDKPHATPTSAQPVQINRTVCGVLSTKEEIDVYRFQAAAGQEVTFSLTASRLYFKRHYQEGGNSDPMLILSDPSGAELASNDDYYYGDPMLHHRFQKAGEYTIAVRDVDYAGAPHFTYSLVMNDRPYVTAVYPLVIPTAGPWSVNASGFGLPDGPLALLGLKSPVSPGPHLAQLVSNGMPTSATTFEATPWPIRLEVEPNDHRGRAMPIGSPGVMLSGRADRANDLDYFAFMLKKGRPVRFAVKARRLGSSLDSHLRLLNEQGSVVASGDDSAGSKDAEFSYTPPADGRYVLEVRDLLFRGGPTYPYGVEVVEEEPDFEVRCDDDRAGVGPGGAVPWFLRVTRKAGFDGSIAVRVEGLPSGLYAQPVVIPAGVTESCLIIQARGDAQPGASPVQVVASALVQGLDGKVRKVEHRVQPLEELYMGGGGRSVWPVETQIAQVVSKDDIASVKVTPGTLSLRPGEQVALEVEITRRPGFKGRATLDTKLQHLGTVYGDSLPPGVTLLESGSKTSLGAEESKGRIILKAAADAKPVQDVPVVVVAFVSIDFVVKRAYASAPIPTTITAPAVAKR